MEIQKYWKRKDFVGFNKVRTIYQFSDFKVDIQKAEAEMNLNSNELGREFRTAIRTDYENSESLFAGH